MVYLVTIAGVTKHISITGAGADLRVGVDGQSAQPVDLLAFGDGELRLTVGAQPQRTVTAAINGNTVSIFERGAAYDAKVVDERSAGLDLGATDEPGSIITQMPGAILRVLAKEGDQVQVGDVLVVVEAMKMENEFKATCDGEVVEVLVASGDIVESDTLLLRVAPKE